MALPPYSCGCTPQGYLVSRVVTPKDRCICTKAYRNLCSKGPNPCAASFQLDLTEYVENSINDTETFELVKYNVNGFSSVTVSSAGLLQATTDGIGGEEYIIEYKVSTVEDGVTYSVNGYVYLCLKDLCRGVTCAEGEECDNCTGSCVNIVADLEL